MNMQSTNVMAPPPPRTLADMKLSTVMMRDIVLKTMFRKNVDMVSDLSKAICLPIPVTQELVDMARTQRLLEATGTLNANNGNEMGYQLTEQGKARALDALAQSEYYRRHAGAARGLPRAGQAPVGAQHADHARNSSPAPWAI